MESLASIIALCPPVAIPIVICVLGISYLWFKFRGIEQSRKATKTERDTAAEQMNTRVTLIENEIERIKALDLESKLAQILTDLQWLKEKLK